ncbi:MAG: tetratricopeptide repeat protein [Tannerellaceae bacterium]|jgi:tetratricopeptide (TPR) repeat protein|nr:tetratricopeptide repeat protein [Tannerellaceae bacterium]
MKNRLIYCIIIALFLPNWFVRTLAQDDILKNAEEAYANGEYAKAAGFYRKALKTYGESAEVYYNLGNAYYKANEVGPAILYYERALLIDPGDADVRVNLELARDKAVDKITPVGKFFLAEWMADIRNLGAADSWAKVGIGAFLLLTGCLFLYFFSRKRGLRRMGFYAGMALAALIIIANVFAAGQRKKLVERNEAIVFAPTVTVKSSPNNSGTDLFVLHEGTKVMIRNTVGDWKEIELEDGNVGWLPGKDIELI